MCKEFLLNGLVMQSALYDLPSEKERLRSNAELGNLFANIIVHSKIESFYEVGALYAEFSMFIKDTIKDVYAFEASPRNYNLAKDKIKGINYLNLAISDYDGEIDINVGSSDGANIGADSVLNRIDNGLTEYKKEKVKCIRLDSFIKSKNLENKSNALWIDVEGSTMDVLVGAEKTLINTKIIFIEVEEAIFWENQVLVSEINKYLCNKGFIPIARDFEYENQFNIVYVKENILYSSAVDISLQMFYAGVSTKGSTYVQTV